MGRTARGSAAEAQGPQKTRCAHGLMEEEVENFPLTRRKRLRGKVTDREHQLSLVTEALPDVKESDSRDGLKAPVRRRSSVRARSDAPPDPSSATRAPAQRARRSKKPQAPPHAGGLHDSQGEHTPGRLTPDALREFGQWARRVKARGSQPLGEQHDQVAAVQRQGERPGDRAAGRPSSHPRAQSAKDRPPGNQDVSLKGGKR